jgi:hypothetical protein
MAEGAVEDFMGKDEGVFLVGEGGGELGGVEEVRAVGGEGADGGIRDDFEVKGEGSKEWFIEDESSEATGDAIGNGCGAGHVDLSFKF